jgi:hypothetical protein
MAIPDCGAGVPTRAYRRFSAGMILNRPIPLALRARKSHPAVT